MKKYAKWLVICLILIISIPSYSLKLRPIGFDKRIDNGEGYQEFTVTNTTNEIMRYKVVIKDTGKEKDISDLISVYPKVFTVEPQSEKIFKVYVEEKELPEGEYNFILGIHPVKMPNLKEVGEGRTAGTVAMKMAMEVEMMGYSGDLKEEFNILNSKFYEKNGDTYYKAEIENKIGRGYELAIGFTDKMNNLMEVEPLGRLFHGNKTIIDVKIPKMARYLVFYDYNNYKVVCQKIKIK